MISEAEDAPRERAELDIVANYFLGNRHWTLMSTYGRVLTGPHAGKYMCALPAADALELVTALADGDFIPVHLMHRHHTGCSQPSYLRLREGRLTMVFADREEVV